MSISLSLGAGVELRRWGGGASAPPAPAAPAMLLAPSVAGTGRIGAPLTVEAGQWSGQPAPALARQWLRDGEALPGATGATYLPVVADDGAEIACVVEAANASGTVTATTGTIRVTQEPPAALGQLDDLSFFQDSGVHYVNAFSEFTGSALTFGVTGEGVSVDPTTGALSIQTDALLSGVEVTVTATNSGGTATSRFRLTIAAVAPDAVAPALLTAPALSGSGVIGTEVAVDAGAWSGEPAPSISLQWRRDGVDIPGATEAIYLPVAADDRGALSCLVTASNVAGSLAEETAALAVTFAAPVAAGLADLEFVQDSGVQSVATAAGFTGEGLAFAVAGAGATIDPVSGVVSIPTTALLSLETVTVTATNSGGAASISFRVSVAAAELETVAPACLTAPVLAGDGVIGTEVVVDAGIWSGIPTPAISLQWLRDGTEIPGATEDVYLPVASDDGAVLSCRVTASNVAGAASEATEGLIVTHAAPVAAGGLADLELTQDSGVGTVDATADFTGEGLTFAVTGAGATIDPVSGVVSIPTAALLSLETVTVTAANSGGAASSSFRVTVAAAAPDTVAPSLVSAPSLSGSGVIGTEVVVDAGVWDGVPAPAISLQWLRNGAEIPAATNDVYLLVAADDHAALTCRVTADNEAGAVSVETGAVSVTRPAPVAVGALADLTLVQGSGVQTVAAASGFTGEGLVYAVVGAGAVVDPATGLISIPTTAALSQETVTVTAANSGGVASSSFRVSVALPAPQAVGTLPAVVFGLGSGIRTVSAQAGFAGAELVFGLDAAPAGVSIDAGSGLVSIATDAALAAATITVRAQNSGGSAVQSFAVTVEGAATAFDTAATLGEMSFLTFGLAPGWSHDAAGFARLVPSATHGAHGVWAGAAGDGLYRCLARWSRTTPPQTARPFWFGARIRRNSNSFFGIRADLFEGPNGVRQLQLRQYTGSGTSTVTIAPVLGVTWDWDSWCWFEMEVIGTAVQARVYPESDAAPAWQIAGTTTAIESGGYGPGGTSSGGVSPIIDVRRIEFQPPQTIDLATPAAALDSDWDIAQFVERT